MDYTKYTREELSTLCKTYFTKIDYLEQSRNNKLSTLEKYMKYVMDEEGTDFIFMHGDTHMSDVEFTDQDRFRNCSAELLTDSA